jgi:hypothetical protein
MSLTHVLPWSRLSRLWKTKAFVTLVVELHILHVPKILEIDFCFGVLGGLRSECW